MGGVGDGLSTSPTKGPSPQDPQYGPVSAAGKGGAAAHPSPLSCFKRKKYGRTAAADFVVAAAKRFWTYRWQLGGGRST